VASLESLPRSDDADALSGRDDSDVDESIVNLVEVGRWVQPPSINTRIRIIQANTPSFRFYVPPYVDSIVDSALVDRDVVDSASDGTTNACFSGFHACMFSGLKGYGSSCHCYVCLLLKVHACWSWRKQKFVGEEQCFQKLTAVHVMMLFDFMEGVLGRMVEEAEKEEAEKEEAEKEEAKKSVGETRKKAVEKETAEKTGSGEVEKTAEEKVVQVGEAVGKMVEEKECRRAGKGDRRTERDGKRTQER
jgi:hypothetical protein